MFYMIGLCYILKLFIFKACDFVHIGCQGLFTEPCETVVKIDPGVHACICIKSVHVKDAEKKCFTFHNIIIESTTLLIIEFTMAMDRSNLHCVS